jgi:hypothetical protein
VLCDLKNCDQSAKKTLALWRYTLCNLLFSRCDFIGTYNRGVNARFLPLVFAVFGLPVTQYLVDEAKIISISLALRSFERHHRKLIELRRRY